MTRLPSAVCSLSLSATSHCPKAWPLTPPTLSTTTSTKSSTPPSYHTDVVTLTDSYWRLLLLRQSAESNPFSRHAAKLPTSANLADKISIAIKRRHLLASFEGVMTQNLPRGVVNIPRRMDESDVVFMKDLSNFFRGRKYVWNLRNFLLEGAAEKHFTVFREKVLNFF